MKHDDEWFFNNDDTSLVTVPYAKTYAEHMLFQFEEVIIDKDRRIAELEDALRVAHKSNVVSNRISKRLYLAFRSDDLDHRNQIFSESVIDNIPDHPLLNKGSDTA